MKKQPRYSKLPLIFFLLMVMHGCKSGNDFPYDEGNVEQHVISIKTAQAYTASYRSAVAELNKNIGDTAFLKTRFNLPVAVQFNKDVLALLLNQKDPAGNTAAGIRMYFARNEKNEITLVLVPHDKANNDIINRLINKDVAFIPGISAAYAQQPTGQAVDNALRCPTFCDQLNSGLGGELDFLTTGK